jgi:hypothetical protein
MDALVRARCFRVAWSLDRVRSSIRPSFAACCDRWPVWRCADLGKIKLASCKLLEFRCFSRPGSNRSFALSVRRPPYTPDIPLVARSDCRSGRRSRGNPIILALRQHSPYCTGILLASAIATSLRGLRASMRSCQVPSGAPFRQAQRTMVIAPMIRSRRMSRCPIFEIRPRTCLPPVEWCRGASPSRAAKSRPLQGLDQRPAPRRHQSHPP